MAVKRLAITVSGRVQGVGFRYFAKDIADSYGLFGWVKNGADGSVECEAQGEEADLDLFCKELSQGPPLAKVKELKRDELPLVHGTEPGFEITY